MCIGIGISLVSVVVSHGCIKKNRFALRAMVSVLVAHGYRYWYLIGIGTGSSWVSLSASHGYRYRSLIGIGISLVAILVSDRYHSQQISVSISGLGIGIGMGISCVSASVSHWYR